MLPGWIICSQATKLAQGMTQWRQESYQPDAKTASAYILAMAPIFADFIGEIFGISADLQAVRSDLQARDPVYWLKTKVIAPRVRRHKIVQPALPVCLSLSRSCAWRGVN